MLTKIKSMSIRFEPVDKSIPTLVATATKLDALKVAIRMMKQDMDMTEMKVLSLLTGLIGLSIPAIVSLLDNWNDKDVWDAAAVEKLTAMYEKHGYKFNPTLGVSKE